MIDLTRLNGNRLLINCDLIKFAEASPDTTLALITGEKMIVRESCDEVAARIVAYRAGVLRNAWPDAATVVCALATRPPLAHERSASARPHSWLE
jgi:flagellar protein FlbD